MKKILLLLLLPVTALCFNSSNRVIQSSQEIELNPANEVITFGDLLLKNASLLKLEDSAGGEFVSLQSPDPLAATYSLLLPPDDGDANELLFTDGAGVLDWTATLTGISIDADTNTITNIDNGEIKAGAAIDATKIHDGSVDNTEFGYLNGVTSAIQTQIDNVSTFDFVASNDNRIIKSDTVGGNQIQESGITLDDTDTLQNVNALSLIGDSLINFTEIAEPSTPSAGLARLYFDSTEKKLASKDDAGEVIIYGAGGGGVGDVENIPSQPGFDDEVDPFTHTIGSGSSVGSGGHLQMTTKDSPYIVLETGTTHDHKWCFTPTASTGNLERSYEVGCFVKSTLNDISLCYNDGTNDDSCNTSYDGSDKWKYIFQRGTSATGEQVCLRFTSPSTSDIQVDSCRIGEPKFSTAELTNTQSVEYYEGSGKGSTNTGIRVFANNVASGTSGSGVFNAVNDTTFGFSITFLVDACGSVSYADVETGGSGSDYGLGINSSDLTSGWSNIPYANRLSGSSVTGGSLSSHVLHGVSTWSGCVSAGDVIRPHGANADDSNTFGITRFSAQFSAKETNVVVATDNSAPSRVFGAANTAMNEATVYFLGFSGEQDNNNNMTNVGSGHSTVHTNATYYTVPDSGYYDIHGAVFSSDVDIDSDEQFNIRIYKDGTTILAAETNDAQTSLGSPAYSFSVTTLGHYLEKGDVINLGFSHGAVGQVSLETNNELGYFEVKPTGAKAILAGLEDINVKPVRYEATLSQSIPSGSTTIVNFDTASFDDQGLVTTGGSWAYTAPKAGYYKACALLGYNATTAVALHDLYLYKNGVFISFLDGKTTKDVDATNSGSQLGGCDTVELAKDDTIDIRTFQATGSPLSLSTSSRNHVQIERLESSLSAGEVRKEKLLKVADGGFTGGSFLISRSGDHVCLRNSGTLTHASATSVSTTTGFLPEWARPQIVMTALYESDASRVKRTRIDPNGEINISFRNWSGTTVAPAPDTASGSYNHCYTVE